MIELKNVLVATDFGDAADSALLCGRTLAKAFGAGLHVLNVVDDVCARGLEGEPFDMWAEEQRKLEDAALDSLNQRVLSEGKSKFDERAVIRISGNIADAIVQYAKDAGIDLIVMGAYGRDAAHPIGIGSVSSRVAHAAPCPVLTVKHPEREFALPVPAPKAAAE
jgi:nucleotide-binding universal stress UspA family protein